MTTEDTTRLELASDPVTFEVVRGGLYAICEEMKSVMTRAAFSPLLSLSSDLSCALLDHDGDVVAQGNDIPVHLGAMPFSAKGILQRFPLDSWRPGDAVLSNDPYSGGSHLPDMTIISPIFDDAGVLGFAASRVHWPDIGGSAPGSSAVTDEIVKEGLRIPPVRVIRDGELDPGVSTLLFANVRVADDRMGDFRAQIACNQRGVDRVGGLIDRYGGGAVRRILAETQDYSQRMVERALAELPDGSYRASQHLDGDGYIEDPGNGPLVLSVRIDKSGAAIRCDFAGTGRQTRGPINAPISVTASACYYLALALSGGDVPPNSGAYRPVEVAAPEGSLVNCVYPAPVVSGNTEMSNRLIDLMFEALAPAMGRQAIGGSYGTAGVFAVGGHDPIRDRPFIHVETLGGGMGASRAGPGLDGHRTHMGNTMNLPIEASEAASPVLIERYELVDGSGGGGRWPGGRGVRRVLRSLADEVKFSLLFERALHPAHGALGGEPGRVASFRLERTDGGGERLSSKTEAGSLNRGDRLLMETAGGGGWGETDAEDA
ncbi:MAG: hydantoinase B/oxoprolinase family protein [Alphaproteobacteria bacterium]|jgi:N-methylhydantoinase B|nr:hydantoinase B/oxoprolinase family protein [Alphaproteobacteria bacterium]MDP6565298.1 hydantoinase B/oxoprolinase family protein [Alphaproteobacteria bacterium]MDP6812069.1 hydantoinase B/oxoprolinase family protein [Alphaproteobacteria bacterium]